MNAMPLPPLPYTAGADLVVEAVQMPAWVESMRVGRDPLAVHAAHK